MEALQYFQSSSKWNIPLKRREEEARETKTTKKKTQNGEKENEEKENGDKYKGRRRTEEQLNHQGISEMRENREKIPILKKRWINLESRNKR